MASNPRELARIRKVVLVISAVAWLVLLIKPQSMAMLGHCAAMNDVDGATGFSGPLTWPGINSLGPFLAGWVLMLGAMMAPVLVSPISHIWLRSFRRRRTRSVLLFAAGYIAVWMAAGFVLLAIALAVEAWTPQAFMLVLPAAAAAIVAVAWQFSPVKQRCLNRCYAHPVLAAFGRRADLDALGFGLTHALWCAGSCWALMLMPLLLPGGHLLAMIFISLLIFSERLEAPRPPGWRWRGLGPAIRIAVAQSRLRMHPAR
jgi:predicted metal-binding membrane protein